MISVYIVSGLFKNEDIEDEISKINHKVTTQININLDKFDQNKSKEKVQGFGSGHIEDCGSSSEASSGSC